MCDDANEDLFEAPFEIGSLEEAATYDFMELQKGLKDQSQDIQKCCKMFYLEQVYGHIQKTIINKCWKPVDSELLTKWEDQLWYIFLKEHVDLTEYIPNCSKAGHTIATAFWIVLGGLSLLNHNWRPEAPWKKHYNAGASGRLLPFVVYNFLLLNDKPIIQHTTHDLMGQLFTLASRFYDLEYHPELEIWILWLQTRTMELLYVATGRDMFNSREYCAPRPASSTMFGVSDAFIQETCRLFLEFRGIIYRYKMYPRKIPRYNVLERQIEEREIDFADLAKFDLPNTQLVTCDNNHVAQFFFQNGEDRKKVTAKWKEWVDKNLKPQYHDRSRHTLYKNGLVQTLRVGEMARATARDKGVTPGCAEILKKNRPLGALDHLNYHAFKVPWERLSIALYNLDRSPNKLQDAAFLYLVDQYLRGAFNIRFIATFCRQEHEWSKNVDELEKQMHPCLIQTLGGWDVYCAGEVTQTRNVGKAFLVWCVKIESKYGGHLFESIDIRPMLRELLGYNNELHQQTGVQQTKKQEKTSNEQNLFDSYWI